MWLISEVLLFIYGSKEGENEIRLAGQTEKCLLSGSFPLWEYFMENCTSWFLIFGQEISGYLSTDLHLSLVEDYSWDIGSLSLPAVIPKDEHLGTRLQWKR